MTGTLKQDWIYALRQLRRSPGYALAIIATLALGVGANTAVFGLLREVVFPALPVPQAHQVYTLRGIPTPNDRAFLYSEPAFERLSAASAGSALAAHAAINEGNIADRAGEATERATFQPVSTNFFSVLASQPVLGRDFVTADGTISAAGWPVVLSDSFWRRHFGAEKSVIGRTFLLNGAQIFVTGVAPRDFTGVVPGEQPDFWLPLEAEHDVHYAGSFDSLGPHAGVHLNAPYAQQDAFFWLTLLARVPHGQEAQSLARWDAAFVSDRALYVKFETGPEKDADQTARFHLAPAAESESPFAESYAKPLGLLMGMVALLLWIACLNLASLQRARTMQRMQEFAVRSALGASRSRLLRQLAIEGVLPTLLGGMLSVAVDQALRTAMRHWAASRQLVLTPRFDISIFLFSLALLIAVMALFQLLPAQRLTAASGAQPLLSARRGVIGVERAGAANLILTAQIAFSIVLLSLATLFARTLTSLSRVDAGLDRGHILTVRFDFRSVGYDQERRAVLYPQMMQRISALPRIRSTSIDMCPPPGCLWNTPVHAAGIPDQERGLNEAHQDNVGPDYFTTMGMSMLRGRGFHEEDRMNTMPVAVVNRSFAERLFGPGADPTGKQIGIDNSTQFTIVGEVADAHLDDLRAPAPPTLYLAIRQQGTAAGSLQIRTAGNPSLMAGPVLAALHEIDPQLPIREILPLGEAYAQTLTTERLLAELTTVFSALALALATVGVYGVLSFRVARRTGEFGVRMALGADRSDIARLVLGQATRIAIAGILAGAALSILAVRGLRELTYGVGSAEFAAWLPAAIVMVAASLGAAWLPARRAARVEPLEALRAE
ncbi:ADOP family duplicated permease [Silvibacterium dinghuense]|uniref:FtsX-like permease family protein n=1 Tax=Silvibacterium dinghuense TaxID=1560006 RepID=A0A4Q1SHN7_9BACT|nr:ADOP family duplicated permease [Silvibacterium dinghuense]RXS97101.1 FtsX-like permease family protein [Silvibacterium dinghuense]GGG96238.1 hypothetical protein GCM10011586_09210 [Silvibacterium dinghuense]